MAYRWLFATEVKVYVEGTYTEDEVQTAIYMDVYVPCLTSFGVQLIYHPNQLVLEEANEVEPYLYTPDEVIERYASRFEMTPIKLPYNEESYESVYFIGYQPDSECKKTPECFACITGRRILVGEVNFSRTDDVMPFDPSLMFITFASGNNTTDPMRDFAKDIGRQSYRTGSSNVRLNGRRVKFGSIKIKEAM